MHFNEEVCVDVASLSRDFATLIILSEILILSKSFSNNIS